MDSVLKELWLHSVCDFEPECVNAVLSVFENAENAFGAKAIDHERIKKTGIPKRFVKESADKYHVIKAERILEYCNKKGIRIITMESEEYPDCLKHIDLPPRILFAIGKRLNFKDNIGVSVVGCRRATPQGKNDAEQIGYTLAQNGITVVSGMAEGIDTEAHNGALRAEGTTVAVLAGAVDSIYPRSNKGLYYKIIENGTVLSERPPGTRVKRYFYQQRNRIIVGLSMGTVIVEGKVKSGTAITARLAIDNNRDVFAVPGKPTPWQSSLPNSMISEGAIIVSTLDVPAEYYKSRYPEMVRMQEKSKKTQNESKMITGLTNDDKKILDTLRENGGIANTEMIAEKSGIPISRLSGRLTILSIKGIIRQESGSRFVLIRNI